MYTNIIILPIHKCNVYCSKGVLTPIMGDVTEYALKKFTHGTKLERVGFLFGRILTCWTNRDDKNIMSSSKEMLRLVSGKQ